MSYNDRSQRIKELLALRSDTDAADWHLVFKARYGMQVVFDLLAKQRGSGHVITQVFTCATAVDPIIAAGLRPRYADVNPATVAMSPAVTVDADTRAVVIQHTFGIVDSADSAAVGKIARAAGALVVEDSAHCVGRIARSADGSPVADMSVHSFGVEKMLPTRFGGAIWVNPRMSDAGLRAGIVAALEQLPIAGRRIDLVTRMYKTQIRVLNRLPDGLSRPLTKALTACKLFEPAIAPLELSGGLPYHPMKPTQWMLDQALGGLNRLASIEKARVVAVGTYVAALASVEGGVVELTSGHDQPLVRFPVFVKDEATATALTAELTRNGVYAGRWYRPGLFPGAANPADYGYTPGDPALAVTEDLMSRVVNLPTNVSVEEANRIAGLVKAYFSRA